MSEQKSVFYSFELVDFVIFLRHCQRFMIFKTFPSSFVTEQFKLCNIKIWLI